MKIALVGYGKMGKEVEEAAKASGHEIAAVFSSSRRLTPEGLKESGAEVVIEFTQPDAVATNCRMVAKAGLPIVIGTTGWEDSLERIKNEVTKYDIGCVAGSNFSVGVNLFIQMVRSASRLMSAAGYDAYIVEAHHRTKKDHPSGTANRLAEAVLSGFKSKSKIISDLKQNEAVPADALAISSIRAGTITGIHTVGFDSDEDSIELTHRSKSRKGFAMGAVRAAEWIVTRKGFYRFEENIPSILEMKKE